MRTYTASRVLALLGPTNTGKTHYAIERMLGHKSGMIGFPLRLLARENYDRVVRIKGKGAPLRALIGSRSASLNVCFTPNGGH